ncbi:hypothetical protein M409DRAFT_61330 [Zasmidium cellare ATCC 36951]|uniref:Major facilitator superfamily (MFS) profile domain-containing protein n=1 Tax=Zasmidium cellare ATCC 36951 TaxID=1080233 RepID=A0A6A6BVU4_ZASCE|nr:uncharacterized protein M409DRAFT_61330 [Zasmidium cellare ATCC 36951]KAF2158825.1 hypothetical protein M409DRAFT_61330 [Zasmidium cellare ATCC 36951]
MAESKTAGVFERADNNDRNMTSIDEKHSQESQTLHLHHTRADEHRHGTESGKEVIDPHAGVTKVEAFNKMLKESKSGTVLLWVLGISLILTMFAYSLDQGTTYIFNAIAASAYESHAQLGAITTANQVVRSVAKPFLAKIADITSRPTTYVIVLIFYAVGFTVAASTHTLTGYIVGSSFTAFGKSGLDFLGDLIVADLTSMQWRGFFGSLLSLPFIVTVFIDGFISDGFLPDNWRWGLGMFAIMTPILLIPAIVTLYFMEHKAKKLGMVSAGGSKFARTSQLEKQPATSWLKMAGKAVIDVDLMGLLLLSFGFALILLPINLYGQAKGGFDNPSMIAMIVIGFVLIVAFALYEYFIAPTPLASRNIFMNRAFIAALGIECSTQLASSVHSLYFASYILVIQNWSIYVTNLFTNITTLLLCILGPVTGLILAKTHRYKSLTLAGAVLKLIGYAMQLHGDRSTQSTAILVISQIILGFGAFSVVGGRVASQVSVPHEDLSQVIAQLSLWSSLSSSIGGTIGAVVWENEMLPNMRDECPSSTSAATLRKIYGSIKSLRDYPFDSTIRQCGITAYTQTNGTLFIITCCIAILSIVFCFLLPDYYLGTRHNVASDTRPDGDSAHEDIAHRGPQTQSTTLWGRFWGYYRKETN